MIDDDFEERRGDKWLKGRNGEMTPHALMEAFEKEMWSGFSMQIIPVEDNGKKWFVRFQFHTRVFECIMEPIEAGSFSFAIVKKEDP